MGRRAGGKIEIDIDQLERLGRLHCTLEEVAAVFGIARVTVQRFLEQPKYREAFDRGKGKGKITLRRLQLKMARAGNPAMGIWLGKQILGQRDVQRLEVSGPDQQPVQVESVNLHALSVGELQELYRLRAKMEAAASEAAASEAASGQVVDVKAIAGGE